MQHATLAHTVARVESHEWVYASGVGGIDIIEGVIYRCITSNRS